MVIGLRNDQLVQRQAAHLKLATDMFRDMRASDFPLEQARLELVSLCAMFDDISFLLPDKERPAHKLLSNVLVAYAAKRSDVVNCSVHNAALQAAQDREAARVQYADVMGERLAEAARTVDASSVTWTE